MYTPKEFENNDNDLNIFLIKNYPLALLVLNKDCFNVTNIPVSFVGDILIGHLSARNDVCNIINSGDYVNLIFNSHSSYISQICYKNSDTSVPTWNYCIIIVKCKVNKILEKNKIKSILNSQIQIFEKSN